MTVAIRQIGPCVAGDISSIDPAAARAAAA
jgi:hypothetical protein